MLSGEATNTNFIDFDLTRSGLEPWCTTLEASMQTITPMMQLERTIENSIIYDGMYCRYKAVLHPCYPKYKIYYIKLNLYGNKWAFSLMRIYFHLFYHFKGQNSNNPGWKILNSRWWMLFNVKWAIFSHIMRISRYILMKRWWCLLCITLTP